MNTYNSQIQSLNDETMYADLEYFGNRLLIFEAFVYNHELLTYTEKKQLCNDILNAVECCTYYSINNNVYFINECVRQYQNQYIQGGQKFKIFEDLMKKLGDIYIAINRSIDLDTQTKISLKETMYPIFEYIYYVMEENSIYPMKNYAGMYRIY